MANLNAGSDILKDFIDRVSSGKKIIKYEDGTTQAVTIENAEVATVEGTPINRETLMAVQGYQNEDVNFGDTITKTNGKGETETITFSGNQIIKTFVGVGEKTTTQTITFNENGYTRRLS